MVNKIFSWFRRQRRKVEGHIVGEKEYSEVKLSAEKILTDMNKLNPYFDLREDKWRNSPELFSSEFFNPSKNFTTDSIRVPERFRDWIIGQEEALQKVDLSVIEWIRTLRNLQELEKKEAEGVKYNSILRERPTNNLLLLGEPGTGKSLLIKVMAESLKDKYKEEGIELEDVILSEDRINRYRANVRYIKPAGLARKIIEYAQIKEQQKGRAKNLLIFGGLGGLIGIGFLLVALGLREMLLNMLGGMGFVTALLTSANIYFGIGMTMIGFPIFILVWLVMMKGGLSSQGDEVYHIPNLLVDNNPLTTDMYENVTLISDAALFGEIEWSPWQTGSMAKPPYRRVIAGKIHQANKKILYIDEFRNVTPSQAIKLLTVMEDGAMPIQAQSGTLATGGTSTAGQNIQTPPIKSMFFLFAAGNLDLIQDNNSILNQMPALRDRFENYGDIILLKDEVEATPLNEMLITQVIRDELYRFQFPAMEAKGVKQILDYVKTRATDKYHIKLMFRAVIKVLKRSAQLTWKDGDTIIRAKHVKDAIENYVASIERQTLEHELHKTQSISLVKNTGKEIGIVNGLTVVPAPHGSEGAGSVVQVQSFLRFVDNPENAYYEVTGVVRGEETDMQDSKREVRTTIFRMYGIDIGQNCYVHIKFSQTKVDGPSAGIAMTLSLMSWLGDPLKFKKQWSEHLKKKKPPSEFKLESVPIRQDIAVTGAMELKEEYSNDVKVSAIGGVYEKIRGAKRYGIKYVLLPQENYEGKIITPEMFGNIKAIPADSVLSYFQAIRGDALDED